MAVVWAAKKTSSHFSRSALRVIISARNSPKPWAISVRSFSKLHGHLHAQLTAFFGKPAFEPFRHEWDWIVFMWHRRQRREGAPRRHNPSPSLLSHVLTTTVSSSKRKIKHNPAARVRFNKSQELRIGVLPPSCND